MVSAGDVRGMTEDVAKLTAQISALHAEIMSLGKDSGNVFSSLRGVLGFGGQRGLGTHGGNVLSASFGKFSYSIYSPNSMNNNPSGPPTDGSNAGGGTSSNGGGVPMFGGRAMSTGQMVTAMGAMKVVEGAVQVASGAYDMIPSASGVVNRAGAYYQAALRSPGMNRNSLERATFSALGGGMTGIGSDAQVANILANAGYVPKSQDYLSAVKQVGGAAKYLGMDNSAAASAIAGLQGGAMGANLYQYGVSTMNANGTSKSVGDIAKQLYSVMFPGGATSDSIQKSIRSGYAGLNMQGMGMTADQQQMMTQAFIDIAAGRNPDLASAKSSQGNQNPFDPYYRMNTSSTDLQTKSEKGIISGLGAAAGTIETFNRNLGGVISSLAVFKGYLDGLSGNPQGAGIKKSAGGIGKMIAGGAMVLGGLLLAPETMGGGLALSAAGMAMMASGGGRPGYGSSFGGRNLSNKPGAVSTLVGAGYGARDAQGGNWDSTGGVHQGIDYQVDTGTPVLAVKDGVVSNTTLSADYGQAVIIDHEDGYSSIYAHLSNKEVSPGTRIMRGQEIGKSGKSGNATGPHLHYEVWKGNNNPVDPSELKDASLPVTGSGVLQSSNYMGLGNALAGVYDLSQGGGPASSSSSGNVSVSQGTGDMATWATQLLSALGAPATADNINALSTWAKHEGGHWKNSAAYNPLNTTLDMPGSSTMNGVGVRVYNSWEQGIQATVQSLTGNNADSRGYTQIVNDLKNGASAQQTLSDISNSAWVTGKTGQGSYNGFKGGGTPGAPGISVPDASIGVSGGSTGFTTQTQGSKTVNFHVYVQDVSDAQALAWARKIEAHLNNKDEISLMGGR